MDKIVGFFLERKMFIDILLILIVVVGVLSALNSRKEGFPELSLNKFNIQTIYPGASAKDVEVNVTDIIEDELKEIENIKEILSFSEESMSRIEVQGLEELSKDQVNQLFTDIDNAISRIDNLPETIRGKPIVTEVKTSDMPVFELAYQGEYSILKPYLEELKLKIRKIPGVKNVHIVGLPDEELHILIDPIKTQRYNLDIRKIATMIDNRNKEGSGGIIDTPKGEKKVVLEGKFNEIHEVLNTNLLTNDLGYNVKLKDIASIQLIPEDVKLLVRNNGERGAVLAVQKIGSYDLIDTIAEIKNLLNQEELPQGIQKTILFDQSTLTQERLNLLIGNSIMGFALVFIVLYVFLNYHTALWTALGIPVSLLGMLIFLKAQDISLNLISLAGFILILGMLVDDAVVIAEEYNKNRESGMNGNDSAKLAVKRMWTPILASTLTTIIAFAPLFMLGGFPGAFIWTIPLMVIVGLSFSLLESFIMLPVHLSHSKNMKMAENKWMVKLQSIYKQTLFIVLNRRYIVLGSFVIVLFLSLLTLRIGIKKDPFPQDAAESFKISLIFPLGSNQKETELKIKEVESILEGIPEEELLSYSVRIGTNSSSGIVERGNQNNLAMIFVYLTSYQIRERNAEEIMKGIRGSLDELKKSGKLDYALNLNRIGPPMGRDVEVRIISNNDDLRKERENEILNFLKSRQGVLETESDRVEGLSEIVVHLNHSMLSLSGLTVDDVLTSMKIGLDGIIVTDISRNDKRLDFRLKMDNNQLTRNKGIQQSSNQPRQTYLPVLNSMGYKINLSKMMETSETKSEATIHRIDNYRSNTIYANLNTEIVSPLEVMDEIRNKFPTDKEVKIEFSGQPVETELIFSGLAMAGLVAVLGIYLMIALIFNSYTRPAVIMLSLPFMAIGIAFVLITHGIPGSMMVGIATIGLMGVVVNASIVLVDTITSQNANGSVDLVAILEGSVSRLRPILLTATTTILGVLPTGYGIGGSDPFLSQMSLVLAYGLFFSTAIILILVPVLLMIGVDLRKKFTGKSI